MLPCFTLNCLCSQSRQYCKECQSCNPICCCLEYLCQGQYRAGKGSKVSHIPSEVRYHCQSAVPDVFLGLCIYHMSFYSVGIWVSFGESYSFGEN